MIQTIEKYNGKTDLVCTLKDNAENLVQVRINKVISKDKKDIIIYIRTLRTINGKLTIAPKYFIIHV